MTGKDENGTYRVLDDGRALRVEKRMCNSLLTLSSSQRDPGWSDGW